MSDILIKNMELPKGSDYLHLIIQGGKVHTAISCGHLATDELNVADAIEVKPHGRLIDADKLRGEINYLICTDCEMESCEDCDVEWCNNIIENAPTVLEANYE